MTNTKTIDLEEKYWEMVKNILAFTLKGKNVKVYTFGSRVKGTTKRASDIDLALDANGTSLDYFFIANMKSYFQESNIPYSVDIIDLNEISASFKEFIKNDLIEIEYK
ncbi:MAG: nucleotidyltransferase domain-containing protein [Endomicrobium sp.]|jgi:predicted nucleotidyltransferase|nr:nucleotidyltransferase domain-containing protein [Endomicrobium sp.]